MKLEIDEDLTDLYYQYFNELNCEGSEEVVPQTMIVASHLVLAHLKKIEMFGHFKYENGKITYYAEPNSNQAEELKVTCGDKEVSTASTLIKGSKKDGQCVPR